MVVGFRWLIELQDKISERILYNVFEDKIEHVHVCA